MNPTQTTPLLPLVQRLKVCHARDNRLSKELVRDAWDDFRSAWRPGSKLTPAVIAALVLHNGLFALLFTDEENAQLHALSTLALERFEQRTNPSNNLGKILAAILEIPT